MEQLVSDIFYLIPQFVPTEDLKSLRLVHSMFNEPCCKELFRSFRFNGCTLRYWAFTDVLKWRELKTCSFLPDVRRIRINGTGEHRVSMVLSKLLQTTVNIDDIGFFQENGDVEQSHLLYALPLTIRKLTFENYNLIPLETFPENLEELYISNCHVEPLHLLLLPQKLNRLRLSNCGITTLPYLPQCLQFLDISHNDLTALPDLPPLLHTLICEATKLSYLPPLPQTLRVLEFWDNPDTLIKSLPASLEKLAVSHSANFVQNFPRLPSNLVSVRLNDCDIESIPPNYLPKTLCSLNLSNNGISTLSQLPPRLNELEVSHNSLRKVADLPPTLVTLNLSHNGLRELPELPPKLVNLHLTNNYLTKLPDLPSKLKNLHLCYNSLTELPKLPPTLQTLHCSYNHVDENDWPSFPETCTTINIEHNFSEKLLNESLAFAAQMWDPKE
ncbi:hypothetical protein BKA69DRAFT_1167779 [Paraphysoderma sedebokerense]|nr:hypothetical protein BKA69DRAFT_1040134 [Paraphysoderma sedebokerense]KAI9140065.1 hypothetical protein BKA69DRAFT_1167779 [Paraphysoderma sedebokerense]